MRRNLACFCAFALILIGLNPGKSIAQNYVQFTSGTGFFVTKTGYIITNEHVVRNCTALEVRGAKRAEAKLIDVDTKNDLALLRIKGFSPAVAPLRYVSGTIREGDEVVVMGFPGDAAVTGQYKFVPAKVLETEGPQGEENWLQFTDSAQKGNSGGPLLDRSGNVIGVVTGKTELYRINPKTKQKVIVSKSDVAVTLPVLKRFLQQNSVYTKTGNTLVKHGDRYLKKRAEDYIVNIRCHLG